MRSVSTAPVAILESVILARHTYLNCYVTENEPDNPASPLGAAFGAGGYDYCVWWRIHVDGTCTLERTRAQPIRSKRRKDEIREYLVRTPDGAFKFVRQKDVETGGNVLVRFDLGLQCQIRVLKDRRQPVSEDPYRGMSRKGISPIKGMLTQHAEKWDE